MAVDIAALGFRIESLEAEVAAQRLDKLGKAANDAESAAKRLAKEADKVGRSMQKMGRTMSMYVTAPMVALAGAAVKIGAEFDSTLSKMNTLVGVSRKEIAGFRAEILKLGPSVGRGPNELADALFAITSAGQRGAQAMDTLNKAAKASAIGLGDTRTIALSATAAVQAYGEANMNSTKALEILIGTIEQGNVAAERLAPVLGRVIGIAAEVGVAFEDLGAFIATFTRLGVDAEEAVTSLRSVISTIQKPTTEAVDALAAMGLPIDELRRKIRDEGFIVAFQEMITLAKQTGTDLTAIIPNVRALGGALGVFGGSGKLAEEVLEGVAGAVGTLEERYQAVIDLDPQHAFNQMKAELQSLFITISRDLLPVALEMASQVKEWAASFRELEPETQKLIIKVAMLAAIVGPLLLALGGITRIVAAVGGAFATAAGAGAAGALITAFKTISGLLLGPVGIAAAFGLLVKIIGDEYVESIENAIVVTGEFKALLDSMDASALTGNLIAVAGEVERLNELRLKYETQVATLEGEGADSSYEVAQLEATRAKLEETIHFLDQAIRLRDSYTERLRAATMATQAATAATAELNEEQSNKGNMVKLTEDEAEALADLKDELDPIGKEMREVAKAQAILEKAFKAGVRNGGISAQTYADLARALYQGTTAFKDATDAAMRFASVDFMTADDLKNSLEYVESLEDMEQQVQALADSLDPTQAALREMADAYELLNEAFEAGVITEEQFLELSEAVDGAVSSIRLMDDAFQRGAQDWLNTLAGLQNLFHEDSAAAEALRTAMIALNIVMGVNAVIKQLAEGDVYSAIPRALAVAGLVASMGVATGASGGAGSQRSLQESQGTGTVLGDSEAKSESILRANEITASATTELVGINRGMLHALQNLQTGIGGATIQLARGSSDIDFGELPKGLDVAKILDPLGIMKKIGLGVIGDWINKFLGGKSKVLDQGIQIAGGALADLTEEVFAQAFLRFKSKKHILDDYDEYTRFESLPEEVGTQFALTFDAIYDTVLEAAMALGLPAEEIEAALAAFEIGDIDISFHELTGDEIEEELLAVFGSIFDNLAMSVVPFIDQFQQVGEGLGETLVRVATSVQVVQEAFTAFGITVDQMDPEVFAEMAVELVEMVGGVEEFISQFGKFFDTFASDEQKLVFVTDQLQRAFEGVGLAIPATRDGMWELMQTLDATTEEGRAQMAMLLQLTDVADEYYDLMEKGTKKLAEEAGQFADTINEFLGIGYDPLQQLTRAYIESMKAAASLGASQREYAMITRKFDLELKRMAASLRISVLQMTQQLFGGGLFDSGGTSPAQPIVNGLTEVREVANPLFDEWINALQSIRGYIDDLVIDETYSTLTPAQRLNEAQRQFDELLKKAQGGDVDAAARLPDAARALLENARFMFASGEQYDAIYNAVIAGMESVDMPGDVKPTILEEITVGDTLIAEAIMTGTEAIIHALEQYLLAVDLSTALKDLATVLDTSVIGLAQELGVPLRELAAILGVQLDPINNTTAAAIGEMAQLLGANVFELIEALGVNLHDLASTLGISMDTMSQTLATQLGEFATMLGASVFDLADQMGVSMTDLALTFGVSIADFSSDQFAGLVMFADALGVSMAELGIALGLQLGSIADETSMISEGFDDAVAQLPPETGDELQPYLDAIRDAADPTEREVALQNLGTYILGLPPEIAAPLIPFLDAMGFHHIEPQLKAILDIAASNAGILGWQDAIVRAISAIDLPDISIEINIDMGSTDTGGSTSATNSDGTINPRRYQPEGSYHSGGYVPETGIYELHQGEFVVDKNRDTITVDGGGDEMTAAELKAIREVLTDIREQQRRYQDEDLEASRTINNSLELQAEQSRRMSNG